MPLAWPTGDTPPTNEYVCRRLFIPADLSLVMAVSGTLLPLCEPENWEQITGTLTPEETAALMSTMFYEFLESACMIGMIAPYATSDPPKGTLTCDGTEYQRVDYPNLYNALDDAYIVDADNFEVPDLRDIFVLSAGPTYEENSVGGAATVELTEAQTGEHDHTSVAHTHTTVSHAHTEIIAVAAIASVLPPPDIIPSAVPGAGATGLTTVVVNNETVTINDAGSGDEHENMPPYQALKYCIVAG